MTIIQLKYFIALAESLNFSEVAKQFYVAQTAITYNIKALEQELGLKLFERTTKKTALTEAGKVYYEYVKPAVELIEEAGSRAEQRDLKNMFIIGNSKLCGGEIIYNAIKDMRRDEPSLTVVLTATEPGLTMFDKLIHREIDIALYIKAPFIELPKNSITQELYTFVPRRYILSKDHPFAARLEGVSAESILTEQEISYGTMEKFQLIVSGNRADRRTGNLPIIVSDFSSMLDMIAANLGVACLPMLEPLHSEMVCSVPCIESRPPKGFLSIAATYMDNNRSPYIRRFLDEFFRRASKKFPPEKNENALPGCS